MTRNTDKILSSLDHMTRATAPEQFYAGLRAKMERQQSNAVIYRSALKPAYVTLVLCIFLAINIFLLAGYPNPEIKQVSTISDIQAFATEYGLISQSPIQ
ncbi:MAG: hypothetical protein WKF88_01750 [Ferruginibacter sp.]